MILHLEACRTSSDYKYGYGIPHHHHFTLSNTFKQFSYQIPRNIPE
jgi:hypothetical protein